MEIIIRDEKMPKNCYECSYLKLCSLNPDFKPTISKCPLKPLSQHDNEIRKKAFDEVLEQVEIKMNEFKNDFGYSAIAIRKELNLFKQKLNELKEK